jgi:hypothetical protein
VSLAPWKRVTVTIPAGKNEIVRIEPSDDFLVTNLVIDPPMLGIFVMQWRIDETSVLTDGVQLPAAMFARGRTNTRLTMPVCRPGSAHILELRNDTDKTRPITVELRDDNDLARKV